MGEALIGKCFKVLDKGFVGLVSYHGTDQLIESAARVSYQAGTRKVSDTKNLIRYLYRNNHHSPFELPNLTFHLKMPLFVIQQLLRHRTAKLNQESHRYSEIKDEFYELNKNEWRLQSNNNKQGSNGTLNLEEGILCSSEQDVLLSKSYTIYEDRINRGIAKEIARKDIPHSVYSQMYWQSDLRNLLHFLKLRCDSHAQQEIRNYANVIACITKELFPIAFEAWYDYAFSASNWTRLDKQYHSYLMLYGAENDMEETLKVVYDAAIKTNWKTGLQENGLENQDIIYAKQIGMTQREFNEFWDKLNPIELQDFDISKLELYGKNND